MHFAQISISQFSHVILLRIVLLNGSMQIAQETDFVTASIVSFALFTVMLEYNNECALSKSIDTIHFKFSYTQIL